MFTFLKHIILGFFHFLLSAAWGLLALVIILVGLGYFLGEKPQKVQPKSFLVIDWSHGISDIPIADGGFTDRLMNRLGVDQTSNIDLWSLHTALERAANDDRIVGIFMTGAISDSEAGVAQIHEAREAVAAFKASGKPVYAFFKTGMGIDYYLLSIASRLWLQPQGYFLFAGAGMEIPFFKEAMDRYGVALQEVRAGKYKSALEPFVLKSMSPESRENDQANLDIMWQLLISEIAQARNLKREDVQQIATLSPIVSDKMAKHYGLIDDTRYFDEVLNELSQVGSLDTNLETFTQINIMDYAAEPLPFPRDIYASGPTIAIVYAEGTIIDGEGSATDMGGDRLARVLRSIRQDAEVKAVVLRVNSPGGSALASEVIAREVDLCAQSKPLVVSFGDAAASGGYWISAKAPRIFTDPLTQTGSIGVFSGFPNIQKLANDYGVTFDGVHTAPHAGFLDTYYRPRTEHELNFLQNFVDEGYQAFLERVAAGRHKTVDQVQAIAQGRVWLGSQAIENGLVDAFGSLKTAVTYAAEELKADHYQIRHVTPDYSLRDRFSLCNPAWLPFLKMLDFAKPLSQIAPLQAQMVDSTVIF